MTFALSISHLIVSLLLWNSIRIQKKMRKGSDLVMTSQRVMVQM